MTFLIPALQREVERRTKADQMRSMHEDVSQEEVAIIDAKVHAELDRAKQAATIVEELGKLAMGSGTREYLSIALATEHRTILAQVMRAVAAAVVMTGDDVEVNGWCESGVVEGESLGTSIRHAKHDGRITCTTMAGASLAQYQPII